MDSLNIYSDLIKCGFVKMQNKNIWTHATNKYALPCINTQYINHESEYQYSTIRKLR